MAARIFISFFMCLLSVLIGLAVFSNHRADSGMTWWLYNAIAFLLVLVVPSLWIFLYDLACFITFVAMGAGGVVAGMAKLSWVSFAVLALLVGSYAFLLFLDKRFPKLFPSKLSPNSPLVPMVTWLCFALAQRYDAVAFLIGGGFFLYLSLGSLLAAWRPSLGRAIGIRLLRSPNPAVQGTLRDKAAQRP